jgi:hypothetical protein
MYKREKEINAGDVLKRWQLADYIVSLKGKEKTCLLMLYRILKHTASTQRLMAVQSLWRGTCKEHSDTWVMDYTNQLFHFVIHTTGNPHLNDTWVTPIECSSAH